MFREREDTKLSSYTTKLFDRRLEHSPSNLSFTTDHPDPDVKVMNYKRTSLNAPAHNEPWYEPSIESLSWPLVSS